MTKGYGYILRDGVSRESRFGSLHLIEHSGLYMCQVASPPQGGADFRLERRKARIIPIQWGKFKFELGLSLSHTDSSHCIKSACSEVFQEIMRPGKGITNYHHYRNLA